MSKIKFLNTLIILSGLYVSQATCNNSEVAATATINKTWNLAVTKASIIRRPLEYSSTGSVVTDQRIDIAIQKTALIRKIVTHIGEKVSPGKPLVLLDRTDKAQQRIRLLSPVTGVVTTHHKQAGDIASPGVPVLTVKLTQGYLFETYVAESYISKIKLNNTVTVHMDALNISLKGTVARVAPSGNPLTRRYRVMIAVADHDGLLPGMFGRSRFQIGTQQILMVPKKALTERGGLKGVFVIDDNNKAHFRWLRIGKIEAERVEVQAGLKEGERIVAVIETRLREGDLIDTKGGIDE